MRLEFASLDDQILWHVIRELGDAEEGVSIPYLLQTLSDLGPAAVVFHVAPDGTIRATLRP